MEEERLKQCNRCEEFKFYDEFYSQNKVKADGTPYVYYFPYCIDCCIKKAYKWREENPEKRKESVRKYEEQEHIRIRRRESAALRRENGRYKEWQKDNSDKFRAYSRKKQLHDISGEEWDRCKEYFGYTCAYCGISELKAKNEQGHFLHKEHANHKGANDLSNCIPACRSCNSRKWMYELNEWYRNQEDIFSENRLNKIIRWLEGDFKSKSNPHTIIK